MQLERRDLVRQEISPSDPDGKASAGSARRFTAAALDGKMVGVGFATVRSYVGSIGSVVKRLQHPARLVNWVHARREQGTYPDRPRSFPRAIDLEPTSRCNLRCATCQRSEMEGPGLDLPIERLELVLDRMPWLETIKLMGAGEPLLHPQFFDLVRQIKRRRIRVWTVTNGTTLHREDVQREILESGIDELWISLDGVRPETHARWKGGSDLGQILGGVWRLVELRGDGPCPRLATECTGNPDNLAELPALVDLVADLRFHQLTYVTQPSSWGRDDLLARLGRFRLHPQDSEFCRQIERAQERARQRGVVDKIWAAHRFSQERLCFWPWESCFISADGYVTSCAVTTDPRLRDFGRIDDTPFEAIWNSPQYQGFRRAHREYKIPAICRMCYGLAEYPGGREETSFPVTPSHPEGLPTPSQDWDLG